MDPIDTPEWDQTQPETFKPCIVVNGVARPLNTLTPAKLVCTMSELAEARGVLPKSDWRTVDLLDDYPIGVKDQGPTLSCVGHGLAELLEILWQAAGNKPLTFNPFFAYNLISPNNNGASISDALEEAMRVGIVPDDGTLPHRFMPARVMQGQYPALVKAAGDYRLECGYKTPSWEQAVTGVQLGFPVELGVPVFESWMDVGPKNPVVRQGGRFKGWHAVLAVGYERDTDQLKILNHWGPSWGYNGTAFLGRREVREPMDAFAGQSMAYSPQAQPLPAAA
jgi:hypothetical protein